ncbi:flavin reductase family protein [Rhodococcus sp. BP-349]|uniref:flavin reductase family protein n=1 Tax=unclassified Rhodococcus (in: high G+C Gram-positive bacteria) TaxID=192944 RepID=UPI001C9A5FEF|nr:MULTISPECIES: flavin reductase family protein [unclassified Rhodococcus (in: high G+C Gram-positive bacteria)]MBY6537856.1 flavin reductase family protein [Rhodococcus sp. BP-363]MBY6542193.1 flavin reductase family protein [Rhodococcus sp. BP-369]MBY6561423.1 flavin reductase family protein [Rhodococcus sp. BP-370]MBY6575715.1 flavin reductase family protein [Rhodococcus sp. BP-364]MBY6585016.1 flavin reductase family protein [Rhodococcus sp. BP-358]
MDDVFSRYASGVTVVTCSNSEGKPHGATVSAFTAVSHEPYLCQITLTKRSKACGFLQEKPFAINFLASDQADVAMHFAGRPIDPAPELVDGPVAPVLEDALATISCRPWRTYEGGDHVIFVGEIVHTVISGRAPLLYFGSAFHALEPVAPLHAWDGCSDDPLAGWFDQTTTFVPAHLHAVG